MHDLIRRINYYETDKMGITHHSNYIRFMEEARLHFLDKCGCGLKKFEEMGVTSPVVSVECEYKFPTTFDDEIKISISVEGYTGVKLMLSYEITNTQTGKIVCLGKSSHCFINEKGVPISVRKHFPEFDALLKFLA